MKKTHLLAALLLTFLLTLVCAGALASSDASAVPHMTLSSIESAVPSGGTVVLTVTADLPGFMTLRVVDASSQEIAVVLKNHELHTQENIVSFLLQDSDGGMIPAGSYLLVGTMVSQFGIASNAVNTVLTVAAPAQLASDEGSAGDTGDASDADESGETLPASSSPASTLPASTAVSAEVSYSTPPISVGEEGLQIGAGASDVAQQEDSGYWGLTINSSDEEIWAALTRDIVTVDVDERESAYIYDSPEEGRTRIGTVSGLSQGLNVIAERDDGWSLVEAFRNEDGAFVRGYTRSNRLRTVEPNQTYGFVIDKASQTLIVFKNGERVGSCAVSTGLASPKYLHRETPAGEFITVTRRGTTEYPTGKGYCLYTIRINGNYYLCEIPSTKQGGSDFSMLEDSLGTKASRGNVLIAHSASSDGGINAKWIWDVTDSNKKIKVLIFDDKDRSSVPVGE